jgi:hypothetical protein
MYSGINSITNESTNHLGQITSRKTGFHSEQQEERHNTKKNTRLPGLYIQHIHNEDQCTWEEDEETGIEDQASKQKSDMQMVRWTPRENHKHDTSHWRRIVTHPVSSKGFGEESSKSTLQLGPSMQLITDGKGRTGLVDDNGTQQKWISDQEGTNQLTNRHYICGCVGHGMGNQINKDVNMGILVKGRKRNIDQCSGTENNTICDQAAQKRLCKPIIRDQERQHYSNQVREQARGNSVTNPTISCVGNQLSIDSIQHTTDLQPYSRNTQHNSRPIESTHTYIRMGITAPPPQQSVSDMEVLPEHRRLCHTNQLPTTDVLEPPTRSSSSSNKRFSPTMAKERSVFTPPMETDTASVTTTSSLEGTKSNDDYTILANATLVANGNGTSNPRSSTNPAHKKQNPGRVAIIREAYEKVGMTRSSRRYLERCIRTTTARQYDGIWQKFWTWCYDQDPTKDPLKYDPITVVEWLTSNANLSRSHLNGMRSSVASVYEVLHKHKTPLADTQEIKAFFRARTRQEKVNTSKTNDIWDIKQLLAFLETWGANETMELDRLQTKTMAILCVSTFWRPRSDIGRLQWQDVTFYWDPQGSGQPTGARILARNPKEGIQKDTTLAVLPQQSLLCPVSTLLTFIIRSQQKRQHLAQNHTLFLAYIDHHTQSPKCMDEKTVATKLKNTLKEAGINTKVYSTHSIRSASASAAYHQGIDTNTIKRHGNWSLNSDTFERYYLKDMDKLKDSQGLLTRLILDKC